jgi:hypothetical protein
MTASELRMQLRMQQECNSVVAKDATPGDTDATPCNRSAHRHWLLHFTDREPMEPIVTPEATRAEVMTLYPASVAAQPLRPGD